MSRILAIFLSVYFLIGTILLPNGDFGLLSQAAKLYDSFIQANGQVSFDEFLSEEFLDPYSIPDDDSDTPDEPFEKEHHPVPIDLITISSIGSPYIVAIAIEIIPVQTRTPLYTTYTERCSSIDQDSIFHPPRVQITT